MPAPCIVPGCGREDTRPHLRGALCPDHAPHVPVPPPWTKAPAWPVEAPRKRRPADDPAEPPVAPSTPQGEALAARARANAARAPRTVGDPYVREGKTATSHAAARAALPRSGTHRRLILDALYAAHRNGRPGATDVQLSDHLGIDGNSVRPRRGELVENGLVRDSGQTRLHHGMPHTVWQITGDALAALGHRPE